LGLAKPERGENWAYAHGVCHLHALRERIDAMLGAVRAARLAQGLFRILQTRARLDTEGGDTEGQFLRFLNAVLCPRVFTAPLRVTNPG